MYPSEFENILLSHPAVVDAAVIGVQSQSDGRVESAGEVPRGFVLMAPNGKQATPTVTEKELLDFVNSKLQGHEDLKWDIQIVEGIPRSPAGKILRRELKKMADRI